MQEIKLKSNLIKNSLKRDSITIEDIEWLDNLSIIQFDNEKLSKEEEKNIIEDLDNIFSKITYRFNEVELKNCSKELYDIVMRESTTDEITVDGSREHLFNLEKNKINISNEFKNYISENTSELDLFKYCKAIKLIELEPVVEIDDLEAITKYTKLENLIINIKSKNDYENIKKILENQDIKIKLKIDKEVIKDIKEDIKSNDKIGRKILEIDDISKLSVEEAKELEDFEIHVQNRKECIMQSNDIYSVEQYIEIKKRIYELTKDINPNSSEIHRFLDVYKKLANNIFYEYDELTGNPAERKEAHNLIGGLLECKCVCEGYSKILHQVLKQVELDSVYLNGVTDNERDSSHAWNQVKIDDKWYNCDLTWDTPYIRENRPVQNCLQSDKEFINHKPYNWFYNKCDESFDIDVIQEYMGFDIELLKSKECLPKDALDIVYLMQEKAGTNLRVSINENILDEGYNIGIAKMLDNGENVYWLEDRIELLKEDMTEFLEQFVKQNNIKKNEEKFNIDWIEFTNGIELIVPLKLKSQMLEKGIKLDEIINTKQEKNNELEKRENTSIIEYRENIWRRIKNYIEKVKSNFKNLFNKNEKEEEIPKTSYDNEQKTENKSLELAKKLKVNIAEKNIYLPQKHFKKEFNKKEEIEI